ncbi:hypothetical protein A2U01_0040508, partial [Trifolium medium]|nr:hypothetical protein [Trifolium medium]
MFVEIPHRTFIAFVKTLHNFTEAMVLILAATVNRDLNVIVNGSYISDIFVDVFYNFNTQLQIVDPPTVTDILHKFDPRSKFVSIVVKHHGFPRSIVSDRDP